MTAVNVKKLIFGVGPLARCIILIITVGLVGCGDGNSEGEGDSTTVGVEVASVDGTATLSWVAPSTRVDSTPLSMSELGGYKVYVGSSMDTLMLHADINDPYQMELVVNNLDTGTYYFAVTAYNQYGAESDFSSVLSKTI